jgi:hypothetical protein
MRMGALAVATERSRGRAQSPGRMVGWDRGREPDDPVLPQTAIGATGELRQHHRVRPTQIVHTDESGRTTRTVVDRVGDQDTLDWCWKRDLVTWDQYRAGRRFHRDWLAAGLEGLRAVDVARVLGANRSGDRAAVARLDAEQRVREALRALGVRQSGIATAIICAGWRLGRIEAELGMPTSSAAVVLRLVLDRLAEHYAEVDGVREG